MQWQMNGAIPWGRRSRFENLHLGIAVGKLYIKRALSKSWHCFHRLRQNGTEFSNFQVRTARTVQQLQARLAPTVALPSAIYALYPGQLPLGDVIAGTDGAFVCFKHQSGVCREFRQLRFEVGGCHVSIFHFNHS